MIAQMAGRVDDLKLPAVAANDLSIRQAVIRTKAKIDAFSTVVHPVICQLAHDLGPPSLCIAKGQNRRTAAFGQGAGQRRMVQMAVGHNDMADLLIRRDGV